MDKNNIVVSLYQITFWATITGVVVGAAFGLAAVWLHDQDWWDNDTAWKLFITGGIFTGTSLAIAVITKWLV